jgi:hypothetical protein
LATVFYKEKKIMNNIIVMTTTGINVKILDPNVNFKNKLFFFKVEKEQL